MSTLTETTAAAIFISRHYYLYTITFDTIAFEKKKKLFILCLFAVDSSRTSDLYGGKVILNIFLLISKSFLLNWLGIVNVTGRAYSASLALNLKSS